MNTEYVAARELTDDLIFEDTDGGDCTGADLIYHQEKYADEDNQRFICKTNGKTYRFEIFVTLVEEED